MKTHKRRLKSRLSPLTVVMLVVLILYCAFLLGMLLWAVLTALKEPLAFNRNKVGLPNPWYFENIPYVLKNAEIRKEQGVVPFGEIVWNSILYSVGCAFVNTFVTAVVAYACSKYKCAFSKFIYGLVLVVMVIPVVGNQTSEIQMSMNLGLYDKMIGMLVMRASFLGIYFLVFYDMFCAVPAALSEAAEIDGANDAQIMLKIFFPIASNTFLTVLLINFIGYWNNYQVPMVYVPNHPTLAEYVFQISTFSKYPFSKAPVQLATSLILLLPVVALFCFTHKRLLGNLSIGGVKG